VATVLRVTRRCLADDLGLPIEEAARDAGKLAREHLAIRTFVTRRSGAPEVGEVIKEVHPYGGVLSLHVGRGRAATLYDTEQDVVWLLAYSATHATHEGRDAYRHFMSLDARGELLPTEEDYETLDGISTVAILDAFEDQCHDLIAQARDQPGREAFGGVTLGDGKASSMVASIEVFLLDKADAEQGWVSFVFHPDTRLSPSQVLDMLAAILPVDVIPEQAADFNGRTLRYDELAWTWVLWPLDEDEDSV